LASLEQRHPTPVSERKKLRCPSLSLEEADSLDGYRDEVQKTVIALAAASENALARS
jgi:hypothetical protein